MIKSDTWCLSTQFEVLDGPYIHWNKFFNKLIVIDYKNLH